MQRDFLTIDLTLRCRVSFIVEMRQRFAALGDRAAGVDEIFRGTPFGPWLDLTMSGGDPMLVHMFLQLEVEVSNADEEEMYFDVFGHHMLFGRREFCLITGLLFGDQPPLPLLSNITWVSRVWPDERPSRLRLRTVVDTMKDGVRLSALSDEDVVRVCLVVTVEMAFMGREWSQCASEEVLTAVEDLHLFSRYPWGSHIWTYTYRQMHRCMARRGDIHAKMALAGFTYAFKV